MRDSFLSNPISVNEDSVSSGSLTESRPESVCVGAVVTLAVSAGVLSLNSLSEQASSLGFLWRGRRRDVEDKNQRHLSFIQRAASLFFPSFVLDVAEPG